MSDKHDLSQSHGHVNPFFATFNGTSLASFHQWEKKTLDECIAEEKRVAEILQKAAAEVTANDEGVMNFDTLTMWSGDTQEKTHKLIEFHSQLVGVRNALDQKRRTAQMEELTAAEIIARNGGGDAQGVIEAAIRKQINPSDLVSEACKTQHGKSFREKLTEIANGQLQHMSVDLEFDKNMSAREFFAATFKTSAGWDPFVEREPGWIPSRTTPIQVTDIVPMFMTERDAVKWMEETTYTPAAAETAEDGMVPESAYALTERTQPVQRVAHILPVTEEQMDDEPQVRDYINYIMPIGVRQRLDGQIISGDGAAPNLMGMLAYGASGASSARAATDQSGRMSLYRYTSNASVGNVTGITKPWNVILSSCYQVKDHGMGILGMQMPTHAVLHPNIYLSCLQSESASGGYYVGGPASPLLGTAWGLGVVETTHLTDAVSANAGAPASRRIGGIIGDFSPMFIRLYMRHEFRTEFGLNGTDFRQYRTSVRSSVRACLAILRAGAFSALINPKAAGTVQTDA